MQILFIKLDLPDRRLAVNILIGAISQIIDTQPWPTEPIGRLFIPSQIPTRSTSSRVTSSERRS
jgi:hypothetical protein